MCEIKKMLFSVSAQGNPMAQIWVDDADITKNSDSIYIAIKSQVAYLFFLGVGSKIELKKSKQYHNVVVPDTFTDLFENYKVSPNAAVKTWGGMLNQAFNNCFNSIEFLKNGEVTVISQDEADEKCRTYLNGYMSLYKVAAETLAKSEFKGLKEAGSAIVKPVAATKPSDIKEAHNIVNQFAALLSREVIAKNNFIVEPAPVEEVKETKKSTKKTKAKDESLEIGDDDIPF